MKKEITTMNGNIEKAPYLGGRQTGVTLIEVLVTVVIMAIGLLGLAAMQNTSVKLSYDSYLRTQASLLAYDMMDRIRANPTEIYQLGVDDDPSVKTCVGATATCSPVDMREADLNHWHTAASDTFPEGQFRIVHDNGQYTIGINWNDRYDADAQDDDGTELFVFRFDVR